MGSRYRRRGIVVLAAVVGLVGPGALEPATAATTGAGAVAGLAAVNPTIPGPLAACIATNYALTDVFAHVTTVSGAAPAFDGVIELAGNGGSACETFDGAVGNLNLWCVGHQPVLPLGSSLNCNLAGPFFRRLNQLHADLRGQYCVNGVRDDVHLVVDTVLAPTNAAFGTGPVEAAFSGGVTIG